MVNQASILVVDDELRALESVQRILRPYFDVHIATDVDEARKLLALQWIQVLLCDQRMPNMSGVDFLSEVREEYPDVIRMIISGYSDPNDIIKAVNEGGIYQYICKPWQPDELISKIQNAIRLFELQRENQQLAVELKLKPDSIEHAMSEKRRVLKERYRWESGIVRSVISPMNKTCALIRTVAPYDISVLLSGESGTGKELCARSLHYNSLRQDKPFIAENCGALPDELLESELFGHKRGAFTGAVHDHIGLFERANGGTIFLDEIGETSPAFQVKLLRVIQEGEIRPLGSNQPRKIDVRIITATNRILEDDVKNGSFRQDLFYRLATFTIPIVPIRQRKMDVIPLAISILNQTMEQLGKKVKGFTDEALSCFEAYQWPGNVREIQNEIKRMVVLCQDDHLGSNIISPHIIHATPDELRADMELVSEAEGTLKDRIETLEMRIIKESLMRLRWNKTQAASELGLSRVGLNNKIERYGIVQNTKIDNVAELA